METETLILFSALVFFGGGIAIGLVSRLAVWICRDAKASYSCTYKATDEYNSEYKTSCGNTFYNADEDGGIVTDWMNYCPYCGGKSKEKAE